jgi:hypothetical protein
MKYKKKTISASAAGMPIPRPIAVARSVFPPLLAPADEIPAAPDDRVATLLSGDSVKFPRVDVNSLDAASLVNNLFTTPGKRASVRAASSVAVTSDFPATAAISAAAM